MAFSFLHSDLARRAVPLVTLTLVVFATLNVVGWFGYVTYKNRFQPTFSFSADPSGPLPAKKAYYLQHKDEYTALFLGDSRTLCGMHPDFIDPYWSRTSYNLSHWATWMPMQYALIADIVDQIPKDTVVVWSIGHENFRKQVIRAVYPAGWVRLPQMALWGYPLGELISAQLAFTPAAALIGRRREFFDHITMTMGKTLYVPPAQAEEHGARQNIVQEKPLEDIQARELTAYTEPWRDTDSNLVSVAQYKINGAMARIEMVPDFYRAKQHHLDEFAGFNVEAFRMDDASYSTFLAILKKFKDAGIALVVNEIEEAPYMYESAAEREAYRQWMREHIKPIVEEYGFTYLQGPGKQLKNKHYFDYNHLNEKGAQVYGRAVGQTLRREVAGQ